VGNTASFGVADGIKNMNLAMEAHINAFAHNIAAGWVGNDAQVANAFTAANSLGFKLFFSFDYAGNGPWTESDVYNLIRTYGSKISIDGERLLDFKFEFLACSGSLTDDTKMRQQRRTWSNSSNFGTITIGGNDAGFANVLIQCILRK
jgi:hypothetical protein